MDDVIEVKFTSIKWPRFSLPTSCVKNIRREFLINSNNEMFDGIDLKDILMAWLHDEFNVCPCDIKFEIAKSK
jgi:hypothetical protein